MAKERREIRPRGPRLCVGAQNVCENDGKTLF
jgi:hypothetical protein